MAVLEYSEIKPRRYIIYNNEPYEVLESHVARTQQRKPQNQVKLRHLKSGKVIPATFHASETAEEADISKKEAKFLYSNRGEYWFCDPKDPSKRFKIQENLIGDNKRFLKENTNVDIMIWTDEDDKENIIGIKLPIKLAFKVKEAPPNIKGDTASGGNKIITLENGTQISAPLFIEAGDEILVNTETGEYSERVK